MCKMLLVLVMVVGCGGPAEPFGVWTERPDTALVRDMERGAGDLAEPDMACPALTVADMAPAAFFQTWPAWGRCHSVDVTGTYESGAAKIVAGVDQLYGQPRAVIYFPNGRFSVPPSTRIEVSGPNEEMFMFDVAASQRQAIITPSLTPAAGAAYRVTWLVADSAD